MAKCKFKMKLENGEEWECPLEALPGEDYCYWHKPEDGKTPSQEQLEELKNNKIFGVYLKKADLKNTNLYGAHLENADLRWATLENAGLGGAYLKNANLEFAYLKNANLEWVNFRNANLEFAYLENASLVFAYLKNANLEDAYLENASLGGAYLENAHLWGANLRNANLCSVLANSTTNFTEADLRYANLYRPYVDQTPTLRDAILFNEDTFMEINEIVAEFVKMKKVISLEKLWRINKDLADELEKRGLFYYVVGGKGIANGERILRVSIFDPDYGFIKEPDRYLLEKKKYVRRLKDALGHLIRRGKKEKAPSDKTEKKLASFIREGKDIFYEDTPENLQKLYEASHEVYNKLYYFYIQQGKFEEALQMHYRRNEVRRKLRLTKGWGSKIRAVLYDWLLMKILTGYGIKVERPLIASLITITLFAFLFKLTNGIVKLVDGKPAPADWIDYFYHSVITFTSLGYANIQPNLASHVPQILVAVESFLGLLLMSLFLYTVTFRISR